LRGGAAIMTAIACAFFTSFTGGSGVTILALGGLLMPVLLSRPSGWSLVRVPLACCFRHACRRFCILSWPKSRWRACSWAVFFRRW
jgi:hypothetical protein